MSAKRDIGRRAAPLWIAATALLPVASHAEDAAEKWQWRASIYGWFPAIDGSTQFPSGASGPSIGVDASSIIENLKFTAMGTLEGRKGRWGFWTDVIYLNVGGDKSASRDATVGRIGLPAGVDVNADLNIKSWVWTLAASYAISSTSRNETELLAGARMLTMDQTLNWTFNGNIGSLGLPGRSGRAEVSATNWDAIVGLKGVASLSGDGRWILPYYVDVGTGESKLTWQAFAAVGYKFNWGATTLGWRYLDYQFDSSEPIADINFSGPFVGATFQW